MCVKVLSFNALMCAALTVCAMPAGADTGFGVSATFTIDNRLGSGALTGVAIALNAQGQPHGPLSGAMVSVPGVENTSSGAQGEFLLSGLSEGTHEVTVSKAGYAPVTRTVSLRDGETKHETFSLTSQATSGVPVISDFSSPDGRHFIEGMPGDLHFSNIVTWKGSPGTARFNIAGAWYPGVIEDLGDGKAKVALTVDAPALVGGCSELLVEVTNGEGKSRSLNTGVHISPIPGIIVPWFQHDIPWLPSGAALSHSEQKTWSTDYSFLGTSDVGIRGEWGYNGELKYDLMSASFTGSLGGFGGIGWKWEHPKVTLLGNVAPEVTGSLEVSLAGCEAPTIKPEWSLGVNGKAGISVPVVLFVGVVIPPAMPVIDGVLVVPVVGEVVGSLQTRVYFVFGGAVHGEYQNFETSDCLLGSTSFDGSFTFGLEAQQVIELFGAEAGVYVGGTGTREYEFCPDPGWTEACGRVYVGAFWSVIGYEGRREKGAELCWGDDGSTLDVRRLGTVHESTADAAWQPIGQELHRWGMPNRLIATPESNWLAARNGGQSGGSIEERLVENVAKTGTLSVVASGNGTLIVYSAFDPTKPWYASTDIAMVQSQEGQPWSISAVTDDDAAEFSPQAAEVDKQTHVAAWERVSGDISGTTGPDEVAPHLEVVASTFNAVAGTWSAPVQITSNILVDRNPQPVTMGSKQGVLWIQNEGGFSLGDAANGDRLMFAEWKRSPNIEPDVHRKLSHLVEKNNAS